MFGGKSSLEGILAAFLRRRRAPTWLAMFMSFWTVSENLAALVAPGLKKLSLSRVLVCLTWLVLIREEGYSLRFGWGQETLPARLKAFLGSVGESFPLFRKVPEWHCVTLTSLNNYKEVTWVIILVEYKSQEF